MYSFCFSKWRECEAFSNTITFEPSILFEKYVKDSGVAMDALLQTLLAVGLSSNRLPELRMAFALHSKGAPATDAGAWLRKH